MAVPIRVAGVFDNRLSRAGLEVKFSRSEVTRAAGIAVGVFLLYALYAARFPVFGDGMEIVATAAVGGIAHPPGYPTLTTLMWPLSHGEGAYFRAALLCGAFMAVSVFLLRLLIGNLAASVVPNDQRAVVAADLLAVALGLSFSFLDAATVVEVYSLNALLLSAILVLLVPQPARPLSMGVLVAASLLQGLAATNHLTSLCTGPLLAWRVVQAIMASPRSGAVLVPATGVAFMVGLSPYMLVPLRASTSPAINWGDPQSLEQLLWMLRGGEYRDRQFLRIAPDRLFTFGTWLPFAVMRLWEMVCSVGGQFIGGPQEKRVVANVFVGLVGMGSLVVIGVGFTRLWKANTMTALFLLIAALLQIVFVLLYNIPDIEDYHLGILVTLLPFLVTGFFVVMFERWNDSAATILTQRRHVAVPGFLAVAALLTSAPLYRASENIAAAWTGRVLDAAPPNAMILTHSDYDIYPLWYAQHAEGKRPDLLVVGINFLRYEWYDRMMPPHREDPLGRRVNSTPGHFTQFTLQSHVESIRSGVIDPNLGRVPVLITNMDPFAVQELSRHYRLVPRAVLLTDEEVLLMVDSLALPPTMLLEIESLTSPQAAP